MILLYQKNYEIINDIGFMVTSLIKLKENSTPELHYLMLQLLFQLTAVPDMNLRVLNVQKLIKKNGMLILINHLVSLLNFDDVDYGNYADLKVQLRDSGASWDLNYTSLIFPRDAIDETFKKSNEMLLVFAIMNMCISTTKCNEESPFIIYPAPASQTFIMNQDIIKIFTQFLLLKDHVVVSKILMFLRENYKTTVMVGLLTSIPGFWSRLLHFACTNDIECQNAPMLLKDIILIKCRDKNFEEFLGSDSSDNSKIGEFDQNLFRLLPKYVV
jgi:hypothetical protein